MEPQGRKSAVAWLSVISNTLLVVAKFVVGMLIGSVSVISEAIHSGKDLSVEESHRISDAITHAIKGELAGSAVTIHVEPCNGECRPACVEGCLLTETERAAVHARRELVTP